MFNPPFKDKGMALHSQYCDNCVLFVWWFFSEFHFDFSLWISLECIGYSTYRYFLIYTNMICLLVVLIIIYIQRHTWFFYIGSSFHPQKKHAWLVLIMVQGFQCYQIRTKFTNQCYEFGNIHDMYMTVSSIYTFSHLILLFLYMFKIMDRTCSS